MKFTVSCLQSDVFTGDVRNNIERMGDLAEKCLKYNPDFIVLPELWGTGFAYDNLKELAKESLEAQLNFLRDLAKRSKAHIIGGTVPEYDKGKVYNTCFVFDPEGRELGKFSKVHLFEPQKEHEYFTPGKSTKAIETRFGKIGVVVCYDLRFPELIITKSLQGIKLLFVPAQFPNPREDHWRTLLKARAIENQIFVVGCNRVGGRKLTHFGHSMVVDPYGTIQEEAGDKESVLTASIDLKKIDEVREFFPYYRSRRPEIYKL